ncbi:MAG: two-component system CitB family response regulator [Motiliproteus sp.]|jgi:two-component system CitB family response regulator
MSDVIRVVIAEDDSRIAEIQKRFLERIPGFELVGIAHGLEEARDLVEVLEPELLLLDIQFPTGTGLELLRTLRSQNCRTDVILVTAATEVDTLREALRGGVFDYILKPLIFERLQASLQNYGKHLKKLRELESLLQTDVDTLLPRTQQSAGLETPGRLPKGIDSLTLETIRALFAAEASLLSAEEVGTTIGASRTTARRYLEYLVGTRELQARVSYGTVGRPERRYCRSGVTQRG